MRAGKVVENRWFRIYLYKSAGHTARLGLAIGKRVMFTATTRNFAKRLIRETFRREISFEFPLDVIVYVKRPLSPKASAKGRRALVELLKADQP